MNSCRSSLFPIPSLVVPRRGVSTPGICVYSFVLFSNARLLKDFSTCREKIPCPPITKHPSSLLSGEGVHERRATYSRRLE
ncbi:hypothetical protein BJX64DRAFT_269513 [Aspergillus heterothallicus]